MRSFADANGPRPVDESVRSCPFKLSTSELDTFKRGKRRQGLMADSKLTVPFNERKRKKARIMPAAGRRPVPSVPPTRSQNKNKARINKNKASNWLFEMFERTPTLFQ